MTEMNCEYNRKDCDYPNVLETFLLCQLSGTPAVTPSVLHRVTAYDEKEKEQERKTARK